MSQVVDNNNNSIMSMMTHAINEWDSVQQLFYDKKPVIFLDYDGTLSPIVDKPECAFMSQEMRNVLHEVANYYTTAIVTGRSREKVYDFVQLDHIVYAGSHGFDIKGPEKLPIECQIGDEFRPHLQLANEKLKTQLSHIDGCELEDNVFALSVHYRNVNNEEHVSEVFNIVKQYVTGQTELGLKHGKKVLELRPQFDWNKGSAVMYILKALGLEDKPEDIFPFYLGDDLSDEDAFLALRRYGGAGILVRDSDKEKERTADTHAHFNLKNPNEVQTFLARLVDIAKARETVVGAVTASSDENHKIISSTRNNDIKLEIPHHQTVITTSS